MTDYLEFDYALQLVEKSEVLVARMRELLETSDTAVKRGLVANLAGLDEVLEELIALLASGLRLRGLDPKVYSERLGSIRDELDRMLPES